MEKKLAFCNNGTAGCLADSDFLKEPEEDARKVRGNFNGKTTRGAQGSPDRWGKAA